MIDYAKVNRGDILEIINPGAPGYAELGDLVRVTKTSSDGVFVEDRNKKSCEFVFNCGAARLKETEWKDDFPN